MKTCIGKNAPDGLCHISFEPKIKLGAKRLLILCCLGLIDIPLVKKKASWANQSLKKNILAHLKMSLLRSTLKGRIKQRGKARYLPQSFATDLGYLVYVFGHRLPFACLLLRDQMAQRHNKVTGIPQQFLEEGCGTDVNWGIGGVWGGLGAGELLDSQPQTQIDISGEMLRAPHQRAVCFILSQQPTSFSIIWFPPSHRKSDSGRFRKPLGIIVKCLFGGCIRMGGNIKSGGGFAQAEMTSMCERPR